MRALSAAQILTAWEHGVGRRPAERALALLAAACPERTYDNLLGLSVGEHDRLLLAARELTFGGELIALARCPDCAEPLEFSVHAADLRAEAATEEAPAAAPRSFRAALQPAGQPGPEAHLVYRLPTAGDLIALSDAADVEAARRALAGRCILEATWGGVAVPANELSEDLLAALAAEMVVRDPQAETLLDLTCPACGGRWQALFDIAAFFWTELAAEARRLLREVDALARAYGWREADILALSSRRRQAYLELVWTS
jgi:hypothetical protein